MQPGKEKIKLPFKRMFIWFEKFELKTPTRTGVIDRKNPMDKHVFPSECRERGLSYSAPLTAVIARRFDNEPE